MTLTEWLNVQIDLNAAVQDADPSLENRVRSIQSMTAANTAALICIADALDQAGISFNTPPERGHS